MIENRDPLMPQIGVVTDIRIGPWRLRGSASDSILRCRIEE